MRGLNKNKKGVSPVIATILLIAIVIILAAIIFLWARGFVTERAQKFDRAVELSCSDVNFEAGVFCESGNCVLEVINNGNVPLYGFVVKKLGTGELLVNDQNPGSLLIGESKQIALDQDFTGTELNIVPMILGEIESGKIAHTCSDDFGYSVLV